MMAEQPAFNKGHNMKSIDVVKSYYDAFDSHDFRRARTLCATTFISPAP